MKLSAKLTYAVLAVATIATVVIIIGRYGLIPGLDFGSGQYYYTDIPGWERYFSVRGIVDVTPRVVYYVLFAVWGVFMYKLWAWLDRRSDEPPRDGDSARRS